MRRRPKTAFLCIAILLIAWTWAGTLPMCDLLFTCGCTWPWAGGIAECNIMTPGPPDCPWCSHGAVIGYGIPVLMLIAGLTANGLALRRRWPAIPALAAAAFGWIVAGLLLGAVMMIVDGYPTFLGFRVGWS